VPSERERADDPLKKSPPTAAARRLAEKQAAAARQRAQAAQRRRRLITVGAPLAAVLCVIALLVVIKLATGAGAPKSGQKASHANQTVTQQLAGVPSGVLDQIGVGDAAAKPKAITAPALTSGGKPLVLYVGAEYCPYCAAERWAVAVALERFGSFSGLGQTASSPSDVYPSTPTLTFHGATYTSRYLAFVARETQSNQVVDGQYAPLDRLTAAQQTLLSKYDSGGGIPFIDFAGRYVISGATYDPAVLKGRTHAQVAAALSDPSSPIARSIDGSANLITAAICASTGDQPAAVCTASGVRAGAAAIGAGT